MVTFAPPPLPAACHAAITTDRRIALPNGVTIKVRTAGAGRPVVFIPSLGRGVEDFDALSRALAKKGFLSILPDPRGFGASTGPAATSLSDLADDAAAVAKTLCPGKVDVVGHAFGNRVARMVAARHPEQVNHVVLLAGGGEAQMAPQVQTALAASVRQGELPDAERQKAIQLAFFAKGNDAAVWLNGWSGAAARAQQAAGGATPKATWWTGGQAPILLIQAAEDPVAPPANGEILKKDIGPRLTLIRLDHASHAILPEQPAAVAAAVSAYLKGESNEARLQALTDAAIRAPAIPKA